MFDLHHKHLHNTPPCKAKTRTYGEVGTMKEVVNEAIQPLFCIKNGNKEVLIPIVDSIIDELDRESKCLYLTCPEGLIEVYLD